MKIIALIPARSGSKRVPNKNFRELGGHPLLAWSILTAKECGLKCYVSTDSLEYSKIALGYGAEAFIRDPEAASDTAGDKEVLLDAYRLLQPDLIVYLRPTTPFRSAYLVKEAIALMLKSVDSPVTGLRSVEEMAESAFKCFTLGAGFLQPIPCQGENMTDVGNQWVMKTFKPNGYVDICLTKTLEISAWGHNIIPFITPRTIEIDTEDDFKYAEWIEQRGRRFYAGKTTD